MILKNDKLVLSTSDKYTHYSEEIDNLLTETVIVEKIKIIFKLKDFIYSYFVNSLWIQLRRNL